MSATFSPCRTWRYTLHRDIDPLLGNGTVAFIGLNPSTADETQDDPTIRRCIRFARSWGYQHLTMLNLFGLRSTDPRGLLGHRDPVGPGNDLAIATQIANADLVVCAWGAFPSGRPELERRAAFVLRMIHNPHCLGVTADGSPRHPLYVRGDTKPVPYVR